ncbi:hypothetical protein ACLB2K_049545 [Fragaria x ananassa]
MGSSYEFSRNENKDVSLQELRDRLAEFARVRDWEQYHSPRNLLLALVGEVGELSEIFQWKGEVARGLPNWSSDDKEHLGEELSDVLLYLIQLADVCGLDLGQAALSKIVKNARKKLSTTIEAISLYSETFSAVSVLSIADSSSSSTTTTTTGCFIFAEAEGAAALDCFAFGFDFIAASISMHGCKPRGGAVRRRRQATRRSSDLQLQASSSCRLGPTRLCRRADLPEAQGEDSISKPPSSE